MNGRAARPWWFVLALATLLLLGGMGDAYAYDEVNGSWVWWPMEELPVRTTCWSCHGPEYGGGTPGPSGVHAGYLTTTAKCAQCHLTHDAEHAMLLPGPTITASCGFCHDGTGGKGVYGTVYARTSTEPAAMHRTETTAAIPGGDAGTGGSSMGVFGGVGGTLTCTDCHSPHGQSTVAAFKGDRRRGGSGQNPTSSKLLRTSPGDAETEVQEYGSDWCLACHAGRAGDLSATHNHPVESSSTAAPAAPFNYRSLPILSGAMPTTATALGALGGSNRGYLMPYPRSEGTNGQAGRGPICQQCHEDSRSVGTLQDSGLAAAAAFAILQLDGLSEADNPRFQTFPHEGTNPRFVVETNDDLCLNCHTMGQLP
jgi:hypothetical protein